MNGSAILENVRRYRTIASLYRQTAAFRPTQRGSLLSQAEQWEHRAVAELEAYFGDFDGLAFAHPSSASSCAGMAAAA
jgi:hypothetical protein